MKQQKLRVLVIGASGMLGNTLFRYFATSDKYVTYGTVRDKNSVRFFDPLLHDKLITNIDIANPLNLGLVLSKTKPDLVINCVGVVKQLAEANDALVSIPINSLLPHQLAEMTKPIGARLIHFSTDCVFSGKTGNYKEDDVPDATDLYGRSKLLGEVTYEHSITLRTSIIGHELDGSRSLVNWFLAQSGFVNGYTKALFSGLPCIEIASFIDNFLIPKQNLNGLYHLSADPINKFELLNLIKFTYKMPTEVRPHDLVSIDRTLDSTKLRNATGYTPRPWPEMIDTMQRFQ